VPQHSGRPSSKSAPPCNLPVECSRRFVDYLIQQKEPSFTLLLVQSGSVPKAIEFILSPPADLAPA
jgi:hypothetical protein